MLIGVLGCVAVSLQGKVLKEKKAPQHHAWRFENGAYIETVWDKYKPGLGNTVVVTTGESVHAPAATCCCMSCVCLVSPVHGVAFHLSPAAPATR